MIGTELMATQVTAVPVANILDQTADILSKSYSDLEPDCN